MRNWLTLSLILGYLWLLFLVLWVITVSPATCLVSSGYFCLFWGTAGCMVTWDFLDRQFLDHQFLDVSSWTATLTLTLTLNPNPNPNPIPNPVQELTVQELTVQEVSCSWRSRSWRDTLRDDILLQFCGCFLLIGFLLKFEFGATVCSH